MIKCPQCANSLPDSYVRCQFCGADVSKVAKVGGAADITARKTYNWGPARWVVVAYNFIAVYYIATGAFSLLMGSGVLTGGKPNPFALLGGAFSALVGCALAFRWEVFRSVIYFFLALSVAGGLLQLLMFSAMTAFGAIVYLQICLTSISVIASGLMFYCYGQMTEDLYG